MIETARLILRRWRDEDAVAHNAMCADPEVIRYLGEPPSLADSRDVVARQNAVFDSYGACFWAAERRDTGGFVGWCGIKPGPDGTPIVGEPEIGWSLSREAWGHGYAIEAARAALDWFWQRKEAPRVTAIAVPANERSWGLMIRLGMTRVADGDFDHPAVPVGDPLRRHLTYEIARP